MQEGGERGSASSTVVKFHLSTNQLPNSCRRVLPLTMLRSLSYSRFPPLLPSFPLSVSRFPFLWSFSDSCWLCNIIALFLLTHATVKRERRRGAAAKSEKMATDKIKYKIVKLNKNRENIFAPLMQLRCCCCREANLQCPPPSTYPSLYTCPLGPLGLCPQAEQRRAAAVHLLCRRQKNMRN